jgi:hypothetical protein
LHSGTIDLDAVGVLETRFQLLNLPTLSSSRDMLTFRTITPLTPPHRDKK